MLLPPSCPVCGRPGPAPCPSCRAGIVSAPVTSMPPGVDSAAAFLAFVGPGREVVARLKYRNARSSLRWLAEGMAALVDPDSVDGVTWVPTTGARRRRRGYDQARLLARAVARRLGIPCRALLTRRPGPAQTGRSRAARLGGPRLAALPWRRPPARVLVVDDVITTGATVSAAARVLRSAGSREVHALAAARRP